MTTSPETIRISVPPRILLGYFDMLVETIDQAMIRTSGNLLMLKAVKDNCGLQQAQIDMINEHGSPEAQAVIRGEDLSVEQLARALRDFTQANAAMISMATSLQILRQELAGLNNETQENLHRTPEFAAEMIAAELNYS